MRNPLIQRLLNVYGEPDSPDPAAYVAEIGKTLANYSTDELDRAADVIIRTHKRSGFPRPSEIVAACDHIRSMRPSRAAAEPGKFIEWTQSAKAQADRMIVCEMGRTAADEGWILALHDFCRKQGRLPNETEQHRLKRQATEFDQVFALCARGEGGLLSAALAKLGASMLERRGKYADMAYGARGAP